MADVKHTPGPWFVAEPDSNEQPIVRAEHIEIATCWHHCVESIRLEAEANARLIAAAPDLLAAVKMLLDEVWSIEPDGKIVDAAEAVVAKAEGMPRCSEP